MTVNSKFLMQRRQFFRATLLGAAGYGAYASLQKGGLASLSALLKDPTLQHLHGLTTFDAREILADALNFGPSLIPVANAMQAGSDVPAVFRVFYQTSHDIRNELCLIEHGNQYNPFRALNFGAMQGQLGELNQKAPGNLSALNLWAYKILTTGKINGTTALGVQLGDAPALTDSEIERISLVAGVGLSGTAGVHQRGDVRRVGTLEYAMANSFAGISPIGIVGLGTPVVDSSGGVNMPGNSVAQFVNAIDVPNVYMSRAQSEDNPIRVLDQLAGGAAIKTVRDQMLDAHNLLTAQLENIKRYSAVASETFGVYGQRNLEGLAAMAMFADLFKQGLATVGSVGMNSFDFHATDALRAPAGGNGNMMTETSQALAGVFRIARAAFDSKRDAIVYFTTCSNRSEDWVQDDGKTSHLVFVIKGSDASAFANVAPQSVLLPANVAQVYAEGPGGAGNAPFNSADAKRLKLDGAATVGRLEGMIVRAVGKAINQTPAMQVEEPAGVLI